VVKLCTKMPRAGYSLMEIAIVLGVIGVLLGGIWSLSNNAFEKVRRQKMIDYVGLIVDKTRTAYQGDDNISGDFTSLTNQLVRRDLVPRDIVPGRNLAVGGNLTARTLWDGALLISDNGPDATINDNLTRVGGQTFRIRLADLPYASCIEVMSNLMGGKPKGLTAVVFNNPDLAITNNPPRVVIPSAVRSTTDAQAGCRRSGQNWTVDLIYLLRG